MRWLDCKLQAKEITGTDALGNETVEWKDVMTVKARFTPWTDEQITADDRDVTRNEQRYVLPIPITHFPVCQRAVIENHEPGEITEVVDIAPRYTVIQVRTYKE